MNVKKEKQTISRKNRSRTCIVPLCDFKQKNNLSFHKFPSNLNLKQKWIHNLKINKYEPQMRVCSQHFTKNDFFPSAVHNPKLHLYLKKGVIPQLNPSIPSEQVESPSRTTQQNNFKLMAIGKDSSVLELPCSSKPNNVEMIQIKNELSDFPITTDVVNSLNIFDNIEQDLHHIEIKKEPELEIEENKISIFPVTTNVDNNLISTFNNNNTNQNLQQVECKIEVKKEPEWEIDENEFLGATNVNNLLNTFDDNIHQDLHQIETKIEIKEEPVCETIVPTLQILPQENDLNDHEQKATGPQVLYLKFGNACTFRFELQAKQKPENPCKNNNYLDEKPHKCEQCGKSFAEIGTLRKHKFIHTGEKPYLCKHCGKSFNVLGNLKIHERVHSDKKPFKCKLCGKTFKQPSNLNRHKLIHTGKKPHKCKECDKCFLRATDLRKHEFIHTGEKPLTCKKCGLSSFKKVGDLKRHEFIHTGDKTHKCKHCRKYFDKVDNLIKHELIHTAEKPFNCKECGVSFRQPWHLKTHERIHTGERPHKCKQCDKSFYRLKNLKTHALIHTGEKALNC